MFDIGFAELVLIGIVALVVIGPERLPRVARMTGHVLGRMQRYVNTVKADIEREMQLDELKKLQSEMQNSMHEFEHKMHSEVKEVETSLSAALPSELRTVGLAEPESPPHSAPQTTAPAIPAPENKTP